MTPPVPPPTPDPAPPDDPDDSRFRAAIAGIMADLRGPPGAAADDGPPADPGSTCW